jgi:hypothetical protein
MDPEEFELAWSGPSRKGAQSLLDLAEARRQAVEALRAQKPKHKSQGVLGLIGDIAGVALPFIPGVGPIGTAIQALGALGGSSTGSGVGKLGGGMWKGMKNLGSK